MTRCGTLPRGAPAGACECVAIAHPLRELARPRGPYYAPTRSAASPFRELEDPVRKIAVLAFAFPSLAVASGYSLPNTNPRDLGVSASAMAAQNDSGAAFALPAALARLEGPSAGIAVGTVTLSVDWKDPTGAAPSTSIDRKFTPIGNVSVSYSGKLAALGDRGFGVGLGVQPFGGSVVSWPADWAGRYRIVKVNRQVFSGVLTGGVEVVKGIRFGGGLLYYYTTEELKQNAWMAPFAGTTPASIGNPATWNPALPDATGTIKANGGALSYDVSAEFQPMPDLPLTFGVDYKHKATQTLKGDASWTGLTPLAAGTGAAGLSPFANMDAEQQLTIPNRLEIGAAYRAMKPLLFTFAYTFDRWVVYGKDVFKGANGYSITVPRNYSNGYTLRGGAEYDFTQMIAGRIGVQYDHSGLDPKYYSPTLPDATSWAGTLGAKVKVARGFSIDAAFFYAKMNEVKAEDPYPATPGTGIEPGLPPATPVPNPSPEGTFRGTYDTSAYIFTVGASWTPGAK
jgi:long-chain fatty acid transport protein